MPEKKTEKEKELDKKEGHLGDAKRWTEFDMQYEAHMHCSSWKISVQNTKK